MPPERKEKGKQMRTFDIVKNITHSVVEQLLLLRQRLELMLRGIGSQSEHIQMQKGKCARECVSVSASHTYTHTHFLSLSLSLSRTHTLSVVLSSFAFHKPCSCGCCFCASCTCASTHARRSSHQKDVMKWTPCWNALNTTQMQASLTHCASSRKRMRLCVNNHSCHRLARTLQQTTPLHLQSTLARTTAAVNTTTAATTASTTT